MMAQERTAKIGPDRFLLGIVVGAMLLLVVSAIVVVVLRRSPVAIDPSSPTPAWSRPTLRRCEQAISRVRIATSRQRHALPRRRATGRHRHPDTTRRIRIVVEPMSEDASTATVRVSVTRFSVRGGPFSSSTTHHDLTVRLVREGGSWLLDQAVEPYVFS